MLLPLKRNCTSIYFCNRNVDTFFYHLTFTRNILCIVIFLCTQWIIYGSQDQNTLSNNHQFAEKHFVRLMHIVCHAFRLVARATTLQYDVCFKWWGEEEDVICLLYLINTNISNWLLYIAFPNCSLNTSHNFWWSLKVH